MGTTIRIRGVILLVALIVSTAVFAKDPASLPKAALLQQAIEQYESIRNNGGWKPIKGSRKFYQQGHSDATVKQLKDRLRITGEYTAADSSTLFNEALTAAVKTVQKRFGFKENGVVDAMLIKELNVPVETRLRQLEINLGRLQNAPPLAPGTRLVANIPEFKLHVYEDDVHVFDIDIVVGKESSKTVIFNDEMTHVVFSPYWNVPPSIVSSEILPAMRKSRGYLRRHNYEQTGTEGGLPVIRQKPGPKNSLGLVKFVFPNNHNIYFHDTPAKSLFELRKRTFSHGCIRLAEPKKLAEYLLRNDPQWNSSLIDRAMHAGKEQWVKLATPVAVSLTYYTAWVDESGGIHFREDVYGYDKKAA